MHVTQIKIDHVLSGVYIWLVMTKFFKPACYTFTLQLFPVFKVCMNMLVCEEKLLMCLQICYFNFFYI